MVKVRSNSKEKNYPSLNENNKNMKALTLRFDQEAENERVNEKGNY